MLRLNLKMSLKSRNPLDVCETRRRKSPLTLPNSLKTYGIVGHRAQHVHSFGRDFLPKFSTLYDYCHVCRVFLEANTPFMIEQLTRQGTFVLVRYFESCYSLLGPVFEGSYEEYLWGHGVSGGTAT